MGRMRMISTTNRPLLLKDIASNNRIVVAEVENLVGEAPTEIVMMRTRSFLGTTSLAWN